MKLFGKDLFGFKKKEEKLYDFARHGMFNDQSNGMNEFIVVQDTESGNMTATPKKKRRGKQITIQVTPKGVFEMGSLNNNGFKIITDPTYIREQIADAREKLDLLPDGAKKKANGNGQFEGLLFGGQRFAAEELHSIIERMENRLHIGEAGKIGNNAQSMLDKYPHTSNALISDVLSKHSHLRCKDAGEFIPDFPKEAISAMSEYNKMCQEICGKNTNFYVIADKKDFGEVSKRRDPILLAQSPFGFFWQILGAWDEEMMYLGDL